MIRFISGNAGSGKGSYIIERIRERLDSGKKMYLIVPEQEAVIWEARVCRELPARAALSLETVSFKCLANTVARNVGGLTYNYAGDGKKTLLMWSAISSVYDALKVYGADRGKEDTYVKLMLDTVRELKMNKISPTALDEACVMLEGEHTEGLKNRLYDLSLIYAAYSHLQETDESEDPDDILSGLYETLKTCDFFKNSCVFIDSFYSLTKTETDIVKMIMKSADDVFITFTMSQNKDDIQFKHIRKYYNNLVQSVPDGSDFEETVLDSSFRTSKESLTALRDNLWHFAESDKKNDGSVRVISCRDRYEEARAVGAVIEKLVHEGAAYSEIAVVARDIEKLRGILDSRLDALKIPYHLSKRYDVTSTPAVKLITSLLRVVSSGFSRDSVISCLKTGLCNIDEFESASFEEYTSTWNIRGNKAYLSDEVWSMNPAGFTVRTDKWTNKVLRDANNVREALKKPFSAIWNVFSGGLATVTDIARTLYEILEELDVYSALTERSEMLEECGREEESEVCKKLYGLILDSLDLMVSTIPDVMLDAGRFSRLFTSVAASFDMGSIPAGCDVVILGSAHGVRCEGIKHIIMPGCIEGEFPKAINDAGFFSDSDRFTLESAGIILSDNTKELTEEELFRFWRCITMASESVTLTVPQTDGSRPASPSIGAKRVCALLGITPESFSDIAKCDAVWSEASARDRASAVIGSEEYETIKKLSEDFPGIGDIPCLSGGLTAANEKITPEFLREYREKAHSGRLYLTQSRLDSFSKCRFAYYMKYVLKLDEPKKASVGNLDAGTMIHRILELFFFKTRNRVFPLDRDETEGLVDEIIKEYIAQIMNGRETSPKQKYLFHSLRAGVLMMVESLMEEFAQSDFRPYRFELEFGFDSPEKPVPLEFRGSDGTPASLFGTIDRFDTCTKDGKVYIRVVDYKTGDKKFQVSEIKKGLDLQLLVYLFTLWKGEDCAFRRELTPNGEEIVPAGMLYFSAATDKFNNSAYLNPSEASEKAKSMITRSGIFLSDKDILTAMDRDLSGKYIPDPSSKVRNPENRPFRSLDEFAELYELTEEIITGIIDEMNGGLCPGSPDRSKFGSTCNYCSLKPICRYDFSKEDSDE